MGKVAIIHDWLTGLRGGEKCLLAFLKIYPEADIYTLLHIKGSTAPEIDKRVVGTSFLQKLPGIRRFYRLMLPLYPRAIRQFKLDGYDLVISLSHAAAKNVSVPPGTKHVSYCFTPMRYIWDQAETYFGRATAFLMPMIRKLRVWDRKAAQEVTYFVGISRFIAARIRCYYQRKAAVIYPPVDTSWIKPIQTFTPGKAFLYAGALVPYKKVDLLIEVFNKLGHEFWIAGQGPELAKLKKKAGPNIKFFGAVDDAKLGELYANCRALLFPATEDFGMIPIECLAAGRPVIGMYGGALKESLNALKPWQISSNSTSSLAPHDACGVFIEKRTKNQVQSIIDSINFFMQHESAFRPEECIKRAELFSPTRFYSAWANFVIKNDLFPALESSSKPEMEFYQHA
jgi:glycosyltransferase involved in cell wall biosynthesis